MSAEQGSPRLAWDWSAAALGAVCALPAAVVVLDDLPRGVALAVGVLPAAIAGVAPVRRARRAVVVLGVLTGVPMFVGGALSGVPVLAVAAIAALGVTTALLAARSRVGQIAMTLSYPLAGIGLSFTDLGDVAAAAGLIVAGSMFAFLVSLAWPERPAAARPTPLAAPPTLVYGFCLGAAGATAAAIGFLFDFEHVGWACAAGGTRASRWYVTSAFTTFLVFVLLLHSDAEAAASRLPNDSETPCSGLASPTSSDWCSRRSRRGASCDQSRGVVSRARRRASSSAMVFVVSAVKNDTRMPIPPST